MRLLLSVVLESKRNTADGEKKNDAIMHEADGNNVGEVEKKSSMKLLVASFKTS